MFSTTPEDIARFREVTRKAGISVAYTFKCRRCKEVLPINQRRRVSKYPNDDYVCVSCKEDLSAYLAKKSESLAAD